MGRIILLVLSLFIFSIVLMSCGNMSKDTKLVGTWEFDGGVAKIITTYNKDHTYILNAAGIGGRITTTGTWHVEGDYLVAITKTSTSNRIEEGEKDRSKIHKLEKSILILGDQTYVRKD